MTQKFIAFTGRKGSGKDTCADMLHNGWKNIKFAEPFKNMLRTLLRIQSVSEPTIERIIDGDLKEVPQSWFNGKTSRYLQQTIGSEWGRHLISTSIWVDIAMRRAEKEKLVVLTDARFENEERALKEVGATIIRIVRPNLSENEFSAHASEAYIDKMKVDYEIINDGDLADLRIKFSKVLSLAGFATESSGVMG